MHKPLVLVLALATAVSAASYGLKIVSGHYASPGQFPYIASLRFNGYHSCGASILNELYLLTAAHCVYKHGPLDPEKLSVVVGTVRYDGRGGDIYKVSSLNIYFGYKSSKKHDIAIIRLKTPIEIKKGLVEAVQLHKEIVGGGVEVEAVGWGAIWASDRNNTREPTSLKWISLKTKHYNEYSPYNIFTIKISTSHRSESRICYGDSGGPLVLNGQQIGIASRIPDPYCGKGFADIWTRVTPYLDWIKSNSKI